MYLQATCLWRRALIACTEMSRVLAPGFARRLGVEMTVAQGLLNRLEKEGYIKQPLKGKRYCILYLKTFSETKICVNSNPITHLDDC